VLSVAAGAATGVLVHSKYTLMAVPVALVLAGRASRGWAARAGYVAGVIGVVLVMRGALELRAGQSLSGAAGAALEAYLQGARGARLGQFAWGDAVTPLLFLVRSASPGLVACALLGFWVTRRRLRAAKLQLLLVLVTLTLVLGQKEARYLLPILPIVYALSAVGLISISRTVCHRRGPLAGTVVAAALLIPPSLGAVSEWADHLRGGVNRYPAEDAAAAIASRIDDGSKVSWRGGAFPVYRSQRVRMPRDEYYDTVRLGPAGLSFWLRRPCASEARMVPAIEGPADTRKVVAFMNTHQHRDAVVLAPPRGSSGGSLDLVTVAISAVGAGDGAVLRYVLTDGDMAKVRKLQAPGHTGFFLSYCQGTPQVVKLSDLDARLCHDPSLLGPVWLVGLRRETLIPEGGAL
jgi:hypothetical protein